MCFDYYENEKRKQREAAQSPRNRLPNVLSLWGADTTARIYDAIGVKAGKIPPALKGDFEVDGFTIRVKSKAQAKGGARCFLVVGPKRLVAVGHVGRTNFTADEQAKLLSQWYARKPA